MMAGHVKSVLEEENIGCLIKNQSLSGAIGELPPIECWPEVWVMDDGDYKRAMELIHSIVSPSESKLEAWHCFCGEIIEGQFTSCWQCGEDKPG